MKSNLYETDFVEWAFNQALALSKHDIKGLEHRFSNQKQELICY